MAGIAENTYRETTAADIDYVSTPTAKLFHASDSFIRTIIGPIGSGKSVACCIEILKKAMEQKSFFGYRKSRWVIIRNTYRELIDTTMRTWFDWIPQSAGLMKKQDMEFVMEFMMPDETIVRCEILFRALDRPNDIKKLLSLELTGGWINEVREIPKQVLDMLVGRVGRYPGKRAGGPSWWGVIMDTNPPDSDHWYYVMFEENLPENAEIFHQPSGMSTEAENVENLPELYYENMQSGKDMEWVKVYVHGEYGFVSDGMPVVPEFKDHVHILEENHDYDKRHRLYIGVDFGRTPAAVFAQEIAGQMIVFDELVTFGVSAVTFGHLLKERIMGHYAGAELIATGDPAGDNPGEQIDETCIEILQNLGIPIDPAHTNNFSIRRNAVAKPLLALNMNGEPQLVVSPRCTMLRKGLTGGYKYMRVQTSGEKFQNKPDKSKYSHVCEALQYLCLGAGYGYDVISGAVDSSKFTVKGSLGFSASQRKQIRHDLPAGYQ